MSIGNTSKRIVSSSSDRKNLDDAIDYVAKGWMPISTQVIKIVREKLQSGQYESQREELIVDLKRDFSLFTWFLSKLEKLHDFKKSDKARNLDDYVNKIEIDKLIEVFNETDEQKSRQKRDTALKPQTLALKQAIAAVTTAESAADIKNLDPTIANMCAGIRQLGVNLVAWNYPRIYARALESSLKGKDSLDKSLTKILGYSPMELGTELALKWDRTGGLAALVTNDSEKLGNLSIEARAQLGENPEELIKCIELGETVSKLVAPEIHPEAAAAMPAIISEVEAVFGKGGMDILKQALQAATTSYSGEDEVVFSIDIDPKKVTEVARNQLAAKFLDKNTWVSKCSKPLQDKFLNLYGYVDPKTISPVAINILIGDVVPALGFTRGCVYLVDNNKSKLNPIMRIGDSPITRYRALDCSSSDRSAHPVILALGYSTPLIQENVPVNGEFVSHVTGVFGSSEKTGVLYLEMSEKLARSADRGEALLFFKAVRQALLDCLNLQSGLI